MNATRVDEDFTSSVHVYEPHRAGLPKLIPYFKALWQRRQFAAELSRASIRAANTNTVFGTLWLVLNPLLLACVYFILVTILRGDGSDASERFVHLCSGLFAYYYFQGAVSNGASSVVGGGKLLLNQSFPRMLLPMSALRTAFFRFLPTLIVYFGIHIGFGRPLHWQMFLGVYFILALTVFAAGIGMIAATLQVYFRDLTSFLPYVLRMWLYLSPVLWTVEDIYNDARLAQFADYLILNPLYSMLGGWSELLVQGEIPSADLWIGAGAWSLGALVVGGLFFMSREREFVVRL
jgi:ABC-type polysaccharide/polyol phosphate export permease